MILKVKRLQEIQDLILETDLIQAGTELDKAIGSADDKEKEKGSENPNDILDRLLDAFFSMNEDELDAKLGDPAFERYFGNPKMKAVLDAYFNYLNQRIAAYRQDLENEFSKPETNDVEINRITDRLMQLVARLHVLEKIFERLAKDGKADFSDEIYEKVKQTQEDIADVFALKIRKPAEKAKAAYEKFTAAETQEQKEEAAAEVFSAIHTAEETTVGISKELTDGVKQAEQEYEEKIDAKLGKGSSAKIKQGTFVNKNTAAIIRRIFEFQYTNWSNEADIINEAGKLRTSINTAPDISEDAKEYLMNLVDNIQKSLIEQAKNKDFDTKKFKGIHYDFNKKLPLYERTALPVTGKQIADDSKVMKFRKAAQSFMEFIFGKGEGPQDATGRAFAKTGEHLNKIYSKTLNNVGKVIGKAVKGREGEMKADAFTRLFILDTSVVDQPKPKPVTEDGVAPGVAQQVPGSIGSMGPIVPPTADTVGSGDKFISMGNYGKSKKKKGKSVVLGFADFIKEQNNL